MPVTASNEIGTVSATDIPIERPLSENGQSEKRPLPVIAGNNNDPQYPVPLKPGY